MTYVVTELCVDCKYTDCAAVCPVEAFHELPDRLLINPDACLPECPVEAIYSDVNMPEEYQEWIAINAEEAANYPIIGEKRPALIGSKCCGPLGESLGRAQSKVSTICWGREGKPVIQHGELHTTCQPHIPNFPGSPVHRRTGIDDQLKGIRVDHA